MADLLRAELVEVMRQMHVIQADAQARLWHALESQEVA